MNPMTLTKGPLVRMSIIRDIVFFAQKHGAEPEITLRAAGLTSEQLQQPDLMISRAQSHDIWESVVNQTGNLNLGLEMGRQINPSILGVVGHLYQACPHLLEAMRCVERFNPLFGNSISINLLEEANRVGLRFTQPGIGSLQHMGARQSLDAWMSATRHTFRQIAARVPEPIQLQISCWHAERETDYRRYFGTARILLKAETDIIWFERTAVESPLITSDPELYQYFMKLAQQKLDELQGRDRIVNQLKELLFKTFNNGFHGIEFIADAMHMTPRTLQRRLQAQGYTFSQILEESKQEMSMRLLRSRQYSISEVAYMLGFSEPGSFSRSFRKWTGITPRNFMN